MQINLDKTDIVHKQKFHTLVFAVVSVNVASLQLTFLVV